MVCKEGGGGGDCRRRSNVYSTSCDNCRARNKKNGVEDTIDNVGEYEGETSKSAAERSKNHIEDYKAAKEDSHIYKHKILEHPDEDITFTMKIIKRQPSSFQRMVHENILIEMRQSRNLLNSKVGGYNRCKIPRISVQVDGKVANNNNEKDNPKELSDNDVDKIFENHRKKGRKKVRHYDDEEDKPPPQKRIRSRRDIESVDPCVEPVKIQEIKSKIIQIEIDEKRGDLEVEQKQDIPYFNIFNFNQKQKLTDDSNHKLEPKKGGKKVKVNRIKKVKPPQFKYFSIKDHFNPKFRDNSKVPNDSKEKFDQEPLD